MGGGEREGEGLRRINALTIEQQPSAGYIQKNVSRKEIRLKRN